MDIKLEQYDLGDPRAKLFDWSKRWPLQTLSSWRRMMSCKPTRTIRVGKKHQLNAHVSGDPRKKMIRTILWIVIYVMLSPLDHGMMEKIHHLPRSFTLKPIRDGTSSIGVLFLACTIITIIYIFVCDDQ